jgi:excisionase family DNA binding protein
MPHPVGFCWEAELNYISVAEAAARLDVSPRRVRQLLQDGHLTGWRVGETWLVGADAVELRLRSRPPSGRPLSSASAWNVLAALSDVGDGLERLSPSARSQARARAAQLRAALPNAGSSEWRSALRGRADLRQLYGHPGVLDELLSDPRVVRSGISAAQSHGADLAVVGGAEGYVQAEDLDKIVRTYALSAAPKSDANVWLHVVKGGGDWLFRRRVAPASVVAADLMERDGYRDHAAGVKLGGAL